MSAGIDILKSLCDSKDDFEVNQSVVVMRRHGEDLILELQKRPSLGEVIIDRGREPEEAVPLLKYVQSEILRLPKLAAQIRRALERSAALRPTPYVDGPAQIDSRPGNITWDDTRRQFLNFIQDQDVGSTRLVLLMADAGQGKTVFLENAALEASGAYFAEEYPKPLILPVDLLGRYVGTVDDAIAGSLNNTYVFPGLTQRDVTVAVQNGWLILALDGFDELVARIGARDSFIRITELIDQLNGAGTILLSARKSFFEMQEVSNAIKSYLRPRTGAYSSMIMRLSPWARKQAVEVFTKLGSKKASGDADEVYKLFAGEESLLSEPFFLTRVAKMWLDGGKITIPGDGDKLAQAEYLISEFTKRETEEKWGSHEGEPLLSMDQHALLLGAIAQEMWMSAAFRLTTEELSIAADIGLDVCGLDVDVMDQVKARVPTHGALATSGRFTQFRHQRFFSYFFARRIASLMIEEKEMDLTQVASGPELGPEILDWVQWLMVRSDYKVSFQPYLNLYAGGSVDGARNNAAALLCISIHGVDAARDIASVTFVGDVMKGKRFYSTVFKNCRFWHIDMSDTEFSQCRFEYCEFGDVRIGDGTRFTGTVFDDVVIQSIEDADSLPRFAPHEISERLMGRGAESVNQTPQVDLFEVDPDVVRTVERLVRLSIRLWDIAREEFENEFGDVGALIIKTGLDTGVLKEVTKSTSGPKKNFVRLQVDRDELSNGWRRVSESDAVKAFWAKLSSK